VTDTDLVGRAPVRAGRWLLRVPAKESAGRIFCLPYSGVGASMFSRWPRWIGDYEVCPVQLPGRENRIGEPHFGTYQELAGPLADGLAPYLDRPFVLFGHCAGALPAFETASRLAETGLLGRFGRLVVSAQVAPHDCPWDRFLHSSDAELLDELRALSANRGTELAPAWAALALDVLRKDLGATRLYWRDEPAALPTGITVVHWSADPEVTPEQLAGWARYGADVRFVVLDGGHYDFLGAPEPLLAELTGVLDSGERS
jgi:surfactin synthase thioesterase subunit